MKQLVRGYVTLFAVSVASACSRPAEPVGSSFAVIFRVVSDEDAKLAGARLTSGKQELGVTGADGELHLRLKGREGQTIPVGVDCPEGYVSPSGLPELRLAASRRVGGEELQAIVYEAVCTRREREVVLVVNAGTSDLPVHVGGAPKARTDQDGTAHVLLEIDRETKNLSVSLDTSSRPELKPQNPSRTFELEGSDAILLFDQEFVVQKPRRATRPARQLPKRHVPYRVD